MSAVLTILSEREANRLTDRIKLAIESIDNGLFKLNSLLVEAQNSNAWQVLGYKSWTAYLADLFDRPLRLPAEKRREVVGYLSGEGLSTRAIAPIVGVSKSQVATDIEVSRTGHVPDLPVWRDAAEKIGLSYGDPVIALTNLFSEHRRNRRTIDRRAQISAIYRAWNARRANKTLTIVKLNSPKGGLIEIPEPK